MTKDTGEAIDRLRMECQLANEELMRRIHEVETLLAQLSDSVGTQISLVTQLSADIESRRLKAKDLLTGE